MKKIKAGIVGGAGYTAGELLRLLIYHPQVAVAWVHSQSHAGHPIHEVHTDLSGETGLAFTSQITGDIDVLFLCTGHGTSRTFLKEHTPDKSVRIIDLSQDFRIADSSHSFVYGLPELHSNRIREAQHVANPGCFATAIQVGLLPLAQQGWLQDAVHVQAITGSTGAGQQWSETSHFSWRSNNVSVYKPFQHQHLPEIRQSLHVLQPAFDQPIYFVPIRGNFTRGILASMYTQTEKSLEEIRQVYEAFYQQAPFLHISHNNPHLKQVVNTNKCLVYLEKHEDMLLIVSVLDNLLKGASGQAVQNMNLMFGFRETTGLQLKAAYF